MIPLRDVIPSRTRPVVTVTLLALNVLVFLRQAGLGVEEMERFIGAFGLVPADFSWLAVLTSMFVHGGLMHVAGNMLYLWIFGDNVEDRMGHGRFLAFYLLCGAAAALAQTAAAPDSPVPMVGASGAIAGVMGAYFVLYPKSRVLIERRRALESEAEAHIQKKSGTDPAAWAAEFERLMIELARVSRDIRQRS